MPRFVQANTLYKMLDTLGSTYYREASSSQYFRFLQMLAVELNNAHREVLSTRDDACFFYTRDTALHNNLGLMLGMPYGTEYINKKVLETIVTIKIKPSYKDATCDKSPWVSNVEISWTSACNTTSEVQYTNRNPFVVPAYRITGANYASVNPQILTTAQSNPGTEHVVELLAVEITEDLYARLRYQEESTTLFFSSFFEVPMPGEPIETEIEYTRTVNIQNENEQTIICANPTDIYGYRFYRKVLYAMLDAYWGGPTIANIANVFKTIFPDNRVDIVENFSHIPHIYETGGVIPVEYEKLVHSFFLDIILTEPEHFVNIDNISVVASAALSGLKPADALGEVRYVAPDHVYSPYDNPYGTSNKNIPDPFGDIGTRELSDQPQQNTEDTYVYVASLSPEELAVFEEAKASQVHEGTIFQLEPTVGPNGEKVYITPRYKVKPPEYLPYYYPYEYPNPYHYQIPYYTWTQKPTSVQSFSPYAPPYVREIQTETISKDLDNAPKPYKTFYGVQDIPHVNYMPAYPYYNPGTYEQYQYIPPVGIVITKPFIEISDCIVHIQVKPIHTPTSIRIYGDVASGPYTFQQIPFVGHIIRLSDDGIAVMKEYEVTLTPGTGVKKVYVDFVYPTVMKTGALDSTLSTSHVAPAPEGPTMAAGVTYVQDTLHLETLAEEYIAFKDGNHVSMVEQDDDVLSRPSCMKTGSRETVIGGKARIFRPIDCVPNKVDATGPKRIWSSQKQKRTGSSRIVKVAELYAEQSLSIIEEDQVRDGDFIVASRYRNQPSTFSPRVTDRSTILPPSKYALEKDGEASVLIFDHELAFKTYGLDYPVSPSEDHTHPDYVDYMHPRSSPRLARESDIIQSKLYKDASTPTRRIGFIDKIEINP